MMNGSLNVILVLTFGTYLVDKIVHWFYTVHLHRLHSFYRAQKRQRRPAAGGLYKPELEEVWQTAVRGG